ncbi:MAG: hypothetical protein LBE06_05370 [Azoarcus sp.]|jgi:hypothetical protein|nr:hypothetical protein [Azoarcus sp.]
MQNKHTHAIPAATLEQLRASIQQSMEQLAPYKLNLSVEERREMFKMGEKSLAFVKKAHEFSRQNAQFCPPYLDAEEFEIDFSDAESLFGLRNLVAQFQAMLEDIVTVSGGEAFQSALLFYGSVRVAAKQGLPGAQPIYDELRTRFPGGKRSTGTAA